LISANAALSPRLRNVGPSRSLARKQIHLDTATIHITRAKNGTPGIHGLQGDELGWPVVMHPESVVYFIKVIGACWLGMVLFYGGIVLFGNLGKSLIRRSSWWHGLLPAPSPKQAR
jgi:hypothetical protein